MRRLRGLLFDNELNNIWASKLNLYQKEHPKSFEND